MLDKKAKTKKLKQNEETQNEGPEVLPMKNAGIRAQVRSRLYNYSLSTVFEKVTNVHINFKVKKHEQQLQEIAKLAPLLQSLVATSQSEKEMTSDPESAVDPCDIADLMGNEYESNPNGN